jgi:two-component sensor histidine kinase
MHLKSYISVSGILSFFLFPIIFSLTQNGMSALIGLFAVIAFGVYFGAVKSLVLSTAYGFAICVMMFFLMECRFDMSDVLRAVAGLLAFGLVGFVIGRIHELNENLRIELDRRHQVEDDLRAKQTLFTELLRQKQNLLHEVHHRVKNNLAVIASLFSLYDGRQDCQNCLFIKNMRLKIISMAKAHNSLYQTIESDRIVLENYLDDLTHEILRTYKCSPISTNLMLQFACVHLDIVQAIPLGIILTELLINALRHGCYTEENRRLRIGLYEVEGEVTLQVENSIDTAVAATEPVRAASLGTLLVSTLVDQLRGTVQTSLSDTYTVTVRIPDQSGGPQVAPA